MPRRFWKKVSTERKSITWRMVNLGTVNINPRTYELVKECLDGGRIGQSDMVEKFEREFAKFFSVKHAIAVCNGTMADTIALATLKYFFPEKKKVFVPALTFIAQVNSIYYNHLEPIFYDNLAEVEPNDETLCVFPVHLLGFPSQVPVGIPVIEDACEALGSKWKDKF